MAMGFWSRRPADCQSATQQDAILRYVLENGATSL